MCVSLVYAWIVKRKKKAKAKESKLSFNYPWSMIVSVSLSMIVSVSLSMIVSDIKRMYIRFTDQLC